MALNRRAVFQNHTVICGWNRRGKPVVDALLALSPRPIVVVHQDLRPVIRDLGNTGNVFTVAGDCTRREVLLGADVASAQSVLVLSIEELGESSDARAVQIALNVEQIQSAVYTVVEIRDLRNKAHFSWTKVDDLVTSEEISVRLIAQGIRHVTASSKDDGGDDSEHRMLDIYRQLVCPHQAKSQIFRVDLKWSKAKHLTFDRILSAGIGCGVLPLALVGLLKHKVPNRSGDSAAWLSWKTDTLSNPPPGRLVSELWPEWPGADSPLGVLVLASNRDAAEQLAQMV
jgi:Trk K+ transport system NAD-binding subunit